MRPQHKWVPSRFSMHNGGGSVPLSRVMHRREFLSGAGAAAAALVAGCRSRTERGRFVMRLSHSMSAGPTALHVFGDAFRKRAEAATGGAVTIRIFPSGTLGQEREVVQQLQEGLVDFMVSGTAIWGSVAPKIQVFDFPFLWRDWAHVHDVVDGAVGREAADYLERTVRMRPLAWGDSFGFRQVITRSRDVTEPGHLAGLKIRTIQSPIYVKTVELMGASPTPMAFGEVYTSMQTGVIDGYEHDASTTLQQRFYEVAHYMARTSHIAGVLGLFASSAGLARLPAGLRPAIEQAALEAASEQRAMGPQEDRNAAEQLAAHGMTIRPIDGNAFHSVAERLWDSEGRALGVGSWLQVMRG
jgi:tripartite ATP-independent transporter DctP family solute receptor